MKKFLILFSILGLAFAQFPTTESLFLDIHTDLTADLPLRNPAYLSAETAPYNYAFSYSWLRTGGEYKLPFNPESKSYHNLEVSAYQEMDNGLFFGGRFAYRNEERIGKLWLHNAETNIDIPFYFGDSTTGDFNLNGIDWNIIFSYPLMKNLRIAMDIFYNVDEQFKSVFPKPNSKRNNLHIRPAISFENKNIRLGVTSSIFNFKEEIETKKYSLEQNRTPIFMRIRGLDRALLSYAETTEERLQNTNGHGASVDMKLLDRFSIEGSTEKVAATITDGGSDPVVRGTWNMSRFNYRAVLHSTASRHVDIDLYFQQYWENAQGYHPDLDALIYQYGYRHFRGGAYIPYSPVMGEIWTSEIAYGFEDIHREDNFLGLAHYIPWTTFSVGLDYQLKRKGIDYFFNLNYNNIKIGESIEYSVMTDWYYDAITVNEIAYYATDREEIECGLKIAFPFRGRRAALSGTYKEVRPINNDTRFNEMKVSLEIIF
ncbi:MAG: hypothetical protein K9N05_08520 [Candidatus Marinimicrobia bacterium]|nr:hypothetical protein [Candidatus Neomarinimicrobiota bacterium]